MTAVTLIVAGLAGLLVGGLHFALLRRATEALVNGTGWSALPLMRFAVTGAAAWIAVQAGAGPALALLAGFLAARHLSLRHGRTEP